MAPLARSCVVLTLLLAAGAAPVQAADLEGKSGPISWRISDVRQGPTTMDGVAHARHEFTLVVRNVTSRPLTLRSYAAAMSYAGIAASETTVSMDARLPPGVEYKFQFYALLPCPDTSTPCRFRLGPAWLIALSGRDGSSAEFTAPIDVTLPVESGRPVVAIPKLRVTRAAGTSGEAAARINARFTSNVILVPASAGGEELWLLFDTGAQISMLRPEVARRLGLSVSADGPVFPVMGFGGRVNAALLEWPPLRIGDYVVEHLIGGIAAIPEFPFPIDGVIGANLIEAFRVTIDQRARELRLEPSR